MKNKYLLILAVLSAALVLGACRNNVSGNFPDKENFDADASYALGLNLGARLRDGMLADGIIPNLNEFIKGMRDGFGALETRFELDEAREKIDDAFNAVREEKNAPLIQEEIEFLAQNAKNPGIIITSSGLQYEILIETNGPRPSFDDMVRVHYEGRLADGTLFDSTYEYGQPAEFPLNQVISGWTEGLQLMTVGSKFKFYIPSEIGYGPSGRGPIPPYATLIFIVELLDIL